MQQPDFTRRHDESGATDAHTDAWVRRDDSGLSGPGNQGMPEFLDTEGQPNRREPAVGSNVAESQFASGAVPSTAGMASTMNRPPMGALVDTPYQPNLRFGDAGPFDEEHRSRLSRGFGLGLGTLVLAGATTAGAWWFARWNRERNRPINRMRRTLRSWGSEVTDRIPDASDLRVPEVDRRVGLGGSLGSGLLLVSMLGLRALMENRTSRRETAHESARSLFERGVQGAGKVTDLRPKWEGWMSHPEFSTQPLRAASRDALRMASRGAARGVTAMDKGRQGIAQADGSPGAIGMGLGGAVAMATAGYLAWRVLRGSGDEHVHVHTSAWNEGGQDHTHAHTHR